MSEISRRNFLIKGGAGAAALGALTVLPTLEGQAGAAVQTSRATRGTRARATTTTGADERASSESLVVHIPDAQSGEIRFMIGTREVVKHDKGLVAQLLAGAR